MNTLRWILGVVLALLGGGYLALLVLSHALRKSFGASEHNPIIALLPGVAAAFLFAALIWPENRLLLHLGAAAALALISACVWQIVSESAAVLWFGILYLVAWFVFYGLAGWRSGAAASLP